MCLCREGELSETDQAAVRRLVQRAVAHAVATQGQGLSEVTGSDCSWWSHSQGLLHPCLEVSQNRSCESWKTNPHSTLASCAEELTCCQTRQWSTLRLTDTAVVLQTLVKHISRLEREKESAAAQRKDEQEAAEARIRARNVVHTPQTGVSGQLVGKAKHWQEDAAVQCHRFLVTGIHSLSWALHAVQPC